MENVADALKIAAAVLIFVLALSISINAFGEARIASRTILEYKDREYDYTYVEENKDSNGNIVTERIVGLESIVPTIYKAYKENYKIVFDENISQIRDDGIYKRRDDRGQQVAVYSIDLQNEVLGSDTQKEQFIMAILYGNRCENYNEIKIRFQNNLGIYLLDQGIYDKINNIKLKESIGVYYQEETPTINEDGSVEVPEDNADVPDANKTLKRVITYSAL